MNNKAIIILTAFMCITFNSKACTIFILTDGKNTYFFNNEDNTNPNSKIWFIPGGENHFGCGYVGYDDGAAQGGVNTEGLAFDWYAGKTVSYTPKESLIAIEDSSSERMLETCSNVDEAIEFYKTYREPSFANATIIIADKTGASVIIGARNGELYFEKVVESRVLGWGASIFDEMYSNSTAIDIKGGSEILEKCMFPEEEFNAGTKYSNSYNLNNGDMTFFDFKANAKSTINLYDELEKGLHHYDIAKLDKQKQQSIKPLIPSMNRLILFDFPSDIVENQAVSSLIKTIFIDAAKGRFSEQNYSESKWEEWMSEKEEIQSDIKSFGKLKSLHLVEEKAETDLTKYYYVAIFENIRILWEFGFDKDTRLDIVKVLSTYN